MTAVVPFTVLNLPSFPGSTQPERSVESKVTTEGRDLASKIVLQPLNLVLEVGFCFGVRDAW